MTGTVQEAGWLTELWPAPAKADPIGIPDAVMIRPTVVIVFDAVKDTITVVTPVRPDPSVKAEAALNRAHERISAIVDALSVYPEQRAGAVKWLQGMEEWRARVGDRGLGNLDQEGLDVAQQQVAQRRAGSQGFAQGRHGDPAPATGNLHEDLVRDRVGSEQQRRRSHAVASEQSDLDAAALGHGRHHGAQAGVDEDRVRYRGGRLDEHLAERKVDRLEMRPEQRAIRLG